MWCGYLDTDLGTLYEKPLDCLTASFRPHQSAQFLGGRQGAAIAADDVRRFEDNQVGDG
ncbi:hypothetical protein [Kribbella capetownensis]|uniref:hypothetical protein n=1 Tax=Kribbella capetownensis TaxID=1572659 RepID=UPI001EE04719|nr:hypothetical protein [Kribbella capetownensis]